MALVQNMEDFVPQKSATESTILDSGSILFIKTLLLGKKVDCRLLQEGGTIPNIDGSLELLDDNGAIIGRITVQVKHLTHPANSGGAFYDIPKSIYAYASQLKGEVVIFIACDQDNGVFYWRYIDNQAIKDFVNHSDHIQSTVRYHFKQEESCTKDNVIDTVAAWNKL